MSFARNDDSSAGAENLRRAKRTAVAAAVIILLGITSLSSFYTVAQEETGLVLRFGRKTTLAEPGLHFKLPWGIDQVYRVPVRRQLKQEFGFRTIQAGVQSQYMDHKMNPSLLQESLMVTGDLNMATVEWIVQYRIHDSYQYLFAVRNPDKTFRDAAESAMRQVVGDRTVDEVLTVGRQAVADAVKERLQKLMDEYKMGLRIEQVVLQDVNPPDEVKAAFSEVNQAQQERERLINEARAEYNQAIPRAGGEALQKRQEAEGYATERVNKAQGDAARFNMVLTEYLKAPEATRQRLYLETMEKVWPALGPKYIIDERATSLLPLLPLSRTEASK
ncbi:MAG: FtsH protease activity modulator HflK [Candidatus Sumerlaeota bacterium]|nr:FtsH protease activity modulator HflK [Candidatus Sumerlaeota bacterium]